MSPRRLLRILLAITGVLMLALAVTQVGPLLAYQHLRDPDWYVNTSPAAQRETAHRALAFRLGDPHDAFAILLDHGDASSIPHLRAALRRQPSSAGGIIECTWAHGQLALERLERQ